MFFCSDGATDHSSPISTSSRSMTSATISNLIWVERNSEANSSTVQGVHSSLGLNENHNDLAGENQRRAPKNPSQTELDVLTLGPGAFYDDAGLSRPPAVHSRAISSGWMSDINAPAAVESLAEAEPELERPLSSASANSVNVVQTIWSPSMNKWRFLSACLILLGNGMNDSAPGALLPYIEKYYHLGYALVSLIFIANAIGFILAAFSVRAVDEKFGRSRSLMLCELVLILGYVTMAVAPPFPVFAIAYIATGWAMATTLALNNVFCGNLSGSTIVLGCFHGGYGIGGIIAPIIATTIVIKGGIFSRFYLILIALRIVNLLFAGWAFWHFERDNNSQYIHPRGLSRETGCVMGSDRNGLNQESSRFQQLKQILKNKATLFGSVFIFAYQGAEVAISGWVISFLIKYRGSDPGKVGYVTAGFWGGITLGRFVLSYAAYRVGEKTLTYVSAESWVLSVFWLDLRQKSGDNNLTNLSWKGLVAGALVFQLLVWFVPNVIGDSVAIALLGLLLGPIYPCGTTVFMRLLTRRTQHTAMAFISSAGSFGGALAPFLTGILAQVAGTWVLHPVCIFMFVLMEICWYSLPKVAKRQQ